MKNLPIHSKERIDNEKILYMKKNVRGEKSLLVCGKGKNWDRAAIPIRIQIT